MILGNISGLLLNYAELQLRRLYFSWSLPWKPQIQHCVSFDFLERVHCETLSMLLLLYDCYCM